MTALLALDGGRPVRTTMLQYGRQSVDEADVEAVVSTLRSAWLTTGPKVGEFERAFAEHVGTREAVVLSSGTAALHAAMCALGIGPGDEVIVPALTFVATASCVVFQGATPVFADVDEGALLLDLAQFEARITPRTKAVIAVDYAGHPCDYDALRLITDRHGVALVADACHALGGAYRGRSVGSLADLSVFSLHAVKNVTTGEGGVVTTDDADAARRMRAFRNHGITSDHVARAERDTWFYEVSDLGYNYRLTDIQCALGISQLRKLGGWIARRQAIAQRYTEAFASLERVEPQTVSADVSHARHLFVIRLDTSGLSVGRARIFEALRAEGVGANVHYIPVHLHPYYQERFRTAEGLCPVAESAYERILSLPIFADMTDGDADQVIEAVAKVEAAYLT